MNFEQRTLLIGRLFGLLLLLVSTRVVYWQLVRGDELQPVAIDTLKAFSAYSKGYEKSEEETQAAVDFLTGGSEGDGLASLPQPVIQRTQDLLETIVRGSIFDRNGRLLASDRQDEEGNRFRFYYEPSLAHAVGYVSGLRTGITGLELSYNEVLLGLSRPDTQVNQLLHQDIQGSDLILTIDSQVQRVATEALGNQRGAVVVLDQNGAVLAMVSSPRFDPNRVMEVDYISSLLAECPEGSDCQGPFLNRATQALYPPGSTWKTVSLIAALDIGQVTEETVFNFGKARSGPDGPYYVYEVDGGVIPDPNHRESRLSLEMSYAKSANAAFAQIGDEMAPEQFIDYAQRFGFGDGKTWPFELEIDTTPSYLARDVNSLKENNLLRAATAIGQGELQVSPINMAMVALAVLNDGDLPMPHFVQSIRDPLGRTNDRLPNREIRRNLMKPETANLVKKMMGTVVKSGSGRAAAVQGLNIGGKTGTAQLGGDLEPHAWFIGYAEEGDRRVAIAVLVENGGEGSQTAAPIFAQVAEAAIRELGEPVEEIVPIPPGPAPTEPVPTESAPTEVVQVETPAPPALETTPEVTTEATSTATPQVTETPTFNVPAPDIPRDPNKVDISATSASCPLDREGEKGTGQFIWPSKYQALSGGDFMEGHPGIDLSAPEGSAVYAADAGQVIFAGWTGVGYGNAVLIDHGNGYQTLYGHLSQVSTYCGANVKSGKLIGLSGSTGNSSGPHLHFEVRVPGGYLNPLKVLPLP